MNYQNNLSENQMMPDISSVYPEIYYRLQPYIITICDLLDTYYDDDTMLSQEMIDQITENIYRDIIEMYPDMEGYSNASTKTNARVSDNISRPASTEVTTQFPRFRRGFRRRGLLRDLIDILFLTEFHRRRRRR